jgi:hypothetical protein
MHINIHDTTESASQNISERKGPLTIIMLMILIALQLKLDNEKITYLIELTMIIIPF